MPTLCQLYANLKKHELNERQKRALEYIKEHKEHPLKPAVPLIDSDKIKRTDSQKGIYIFPLMNTNPAIERRNGIAISPNSGIIVMPTHANCTRKTVFYIFP